MDAADRAQFLTIIREETQGLGRQVQHWVAESAAFLGADYLSTEISGVDLLAVVGRAVDREGAITITALPSAESIWVKADSHAIAQAMVQLTGRLRGECGVTAATVALTAPGRHAQIEMRWSDGTPTPEVFQGWLEEPIAAGAATTVRQVVERHRGEIWCDGTSDGQGHLRLLLPQAGPPRATPKLLSGSASPVVAGTDVPSRPEFYDFQLFDRPGGTATGETATGETATGETPTGETTTGETTTGETTTGETTQWDDRALGEIEYTVFDTETTGLDPQHGDEIISLGAVRVVNGRLLRQESFERLVDPKRSVPMTSTAIHGITAEMVAGQPTIDVVLPEFARYALDTVLVGHNVGFDMQFLRLKVGQTGVSFTQPVLDTLLLDAVVHPDHDAHSLEAIAARLGVDVRGRHTALGDALVTGEVFLRLVSLLQSIGITTLGAAVRASRATLQARLDESMYGDRDSV
jgi:DNA polymerase-3 subunit epsilon